MKATLRFTSHCYGTDGVCRIRQDRKERLTLCVESSGFSGKSQ